LKNQKRASQTDQKQRDIEVYREAKRFLLANTPKKISEEILDSYLSPQMVNRNEMSLNDIYVRLLASAQNANMKSKVIGGSIGGVDNLSSVLHDFCPIYVQGKYSGNENKLLEDIERILKPKGKIRRAPKSIWPKYCKTITSVAEYLIQFNDANDFFDWADYFYNEKKINGRTAYDIGNRNFRDILYIGV